MFQYFVTALLNIIIETHRKGNDVSLDYVTMYLVFQIDVRIILKPLKVGCRKEGKPVALELVT